MSSFLALAKFAAQTVASIGVAKVFEDIIKNNVTVVTRLDKVKVAIGGLVIGTIVADKASEQLSKRWDEAVNAWQTIRKEREDKKNATEEEK